MAKPQLPLSGLSILVIEDDPGMLPLLKEILAEAGADVHCAADPEEGLAQAKAIRHLNLIITDVVLPRRSGFQLAAEIVGVHPKVRVLFISGYGDPEIGARDLLAPFDTLLKPFQTEDLVEKSAELARR